MDNKKILVIVGVCTVVVIVAFMFYENKSMMTSLPPPPPPKKCDPRYNDCRGMCIAVCGQQRNFCDEHGQNCQQIYDTCVNQCKLTYPS